MTFFENLDHKIQAVQSGWTILHAVALVSVFRLAKVALVQMLALLHVLETMWPMLSAVREFLFLTKPLSISFPSRFISYFK